MRKKALTPFQLCLSALMCVLLIVSTLLLRFPFPGTDVLFTAQVFAVLLCGLTLPLGCGLYAVCGYLFLGLMGLPVFSSVSGPAAIASPSFGYLLGFPFALFAESFVLEKLHEKKSRFILAALAGVLAIYFVALPYIALLKGLWLKAPLGFAELLQVYCLGFLPMDILKALLSAVAAPSLLKALRR